MDFKEPKNTPRKEYSEEEKKEVTTEILKNVGIDINDRREGEPTVQDALNAANASKDGVVVDGGEIREVSSSEKYLQNKD